MQNIKYEIRPVVGYEGKYSVSNTGEVFSHNYRQTGQTRELKPWKDKLGYLYVDLCQDGKQKQHLIHRLVLQAFVPNPENKPCCDHIDTNPSNPHVSNLRWVTTKENSNNPITRKKNSEAHKNKTIYKFRNKKTAEEFIGIVYDFRTKYDLNQGDVSGLIHGRHKSVKGWVIV